MALTLTMGGSKRTALMLASLKSMTGVVEKLLAAGAKAELTDDKVNGRLLMQTWAQQCACTTCLWDSKTRGAFWLACVMNLCMLRIVRANNHPDVDMRRRATRA